MLNVLCLGAGVQSTTVYHRSGVGELPKLDCAIFADTGWEPQAVYDHLEELREVYAPKYGIPIYVVSKGNIRDDAMRSTVRGKVDGDARWVSIPYRTKAPDGSHGMIKRQCTSEYKIEPIERFIKTELLGLKRRARWPKEQVVRQWFGISSDEWGRMRAPSKKVRTGSQTQGELFGDGDTKPLFEYVSVAWKTHYYPLCGFEFTGPKQKVRLPFPSMSRADCDWWLKQNGFGAAPRSACIGCPYRSNVEWKEIRDNPAEWKDAVEFDEAIRDCGGDRGKMYLHRDLVPLRIVDLSETDDDSQSLFGCDDGICGV